MRTNHSRTSRNATPSAAPIRFSILLALFAIFIHPSSLLASSFPLWGSLKPGKYLVGYRTFFKPDYSRTYKPKVDLLGQARTGDRSRSMQLSISYPAVMPPGGWMSRFCMYIDLLATEEKK